MIDASPQPVDELTSISRCDFLEHYRFKKPFILRGGARGSPAFEKWSLEYLESQIADVKIQPLIYESDKRDYSKALFIEMPFREFCAELKSGNGRMLYWFEGPVSANFWGSPEKHARINADLHMLAADFRVPSFLHESEIIYAQMIIGTGKNGTVAHHDYGGEAKCLIQLQGEKHVLLVSPQHAKPLALRSITEPHNFTISTRDLRGAHFRDICQKVPVYEARIKRGDVLYWPSFWLHDSVNEGEVNLAINAPVDEMPINPLMVRHLLAVQLRRLQELDHDMKVDVGAVQALEQELLNLEDVATMWELHAASIQYRGMHWRAKREQQRTEAAVTGVA